MSFLLHVRALWLHFSVACGKRHVGTVENTCTKNCVHKKRNTLIYDSYSSFKNEINQFQLMQMGRRRKLKRPYEKVRALPALQCTVVVCKRVCVWHTVCVWRWRVGGWRGMLVTSL